VYTHCDQKKKLSWLIPETSKTRKKGTEKVSLCLSSEIVSFTKLAIIVHIDKMNDFNFSLSKVNGLYFSLFKKNYLKVFIVWEELFILTIA